MANGSPGPEAGARAKAGLFAGTGAGPKAAPMLGPTAGRGAGLGGDPYRGGLLSGGLDERGLGNALGAPGSAQSHL